MATTAPSVSPDRTDVMSGSYAVYVDTEFIHVWEYRATVSSPDGEWKFVETLNRDDDPRLSLEYALPTAPTPEGYWIYSGTYACELDCE